MNINCLNTYDVIFRLTLQLNKTEERSPLNSGKNKNLLILSTEEVSWMGDHLETHSEIKGKGDSERSQSK